MWRAGPFFRLGEHLKVEAELCGFGARRHKVCAREAGKKVIQCHFVRQVDHREAQTPTVAVTAEQVFVPDRDIEQVARLDSVGIVVVILLARDSIETTLRERD